jgi:hypothetical protein
MEEERTLEDLETLVARLSLDVLNLHEAVSCLYNIITTVPCLRGIDEGKVD